MEEAVSLIDRIIDEHKLIMHDMQTTENAANDIAALFELYKPVEGSAPQTSSDYRQHMSDLQSSLNTVEELLLHHFAHEEKLLKIASQKGPESAITSALKVLIDEHGEIKRRIHREKNDIAEIIDGRLSDNEVGGKSFMVRAYLRHTMTLIEAHAHTEEELLQSLREELTST